MNVITVLSSSKRLLKQKVEERLKQDRSNKSHFRLESYSDFISLLKEKLESIPEQRRNFYIKWTAVRYAQGKAQWMEDIDSKAIPAVLQHHDLYKRDALRLEHKDLSRVRSTVDLVEIMNSYVYKESDEMSDTEEGAEFFRSGEAKVLYEDSRIKIMMIKSYKASCFFGSKLWCLARRERWWQRYKAAGNKVYFIFFFDTPKSNPEHRWAFLRNKEIWNSSLWNAVDNDPKPTPRELLFRRRKQYPVLRKLFKGTVFAGNVPAAYIKKMLNSSHDGVKESIMYAELSSVDVWKHVLDRFGSSYFKRVLPPADIREEVFLYAAKTYAVALYHILNAGIVPSEEVQLAAVKENEDSVRFILNAGITPSEEIQKLVIEYNPHTLRWFFAAGIVPSDEIQLAAVKDDGYALWYILEAGITPSEEVQLVAITDTGYVDDVLDDILKAGIVPSEEVQLAAVKRSWHAAMRLQKEGILLSDRVMEAIHETWQS